MNDQLNEQKKSASENIADVAALMLPGGFYVECLLSFNYGSSLYIIRPSQIVGNYGKAANVDEL